MRTKKNTYFKLLLLAFYSFVCLQTTLAQNTNVPFIDQDSAYYAQKQANYSNNPTVLSGRPGTKISDLTGRNAIKDQNPVKSNGVASRGITESCIIPTDETWSILPGNDDGSTGVINLGFTFDFYGTPYTQLYINNNGNLTFDNPYFQFVPAGFPTNTTKMIAAFWDDIDTRSCGRVRYKLFDTRLVVSYEGVGKYSNICSALNTFQIIIGTTNDPLLGLGQNVKFNYRDMQWTGGASTVGLNKGDGVNYVQVGRFGIQDSETYDGGGGNTDGLDYLDYQCFTFNVSNSGNIPPSFSGLPAGNFLSIECGQTVNLSIQSLPPEVNQTVTSTLNTGGLCNTNFTTTNGVVSTTSLSITGAACNIGTHTISITAVDNGTPNETSTAILTVEVVAPVPVISSLSPTNASPGSNVVISGSNYSSSGNTVTLGGINLPVVNESINSITVSLPANICNGNIIVTNSCGGISSGFTYSGIIAPILTSVNLVTGTPGAIAINGDHFGSTGAAVTIGGVAASIINQTNTTITATLPRGVCSAQSNVVIANNCGTLSNGIPVNTLPPIPAVVANGTTTFCQGGSVTLSSSSITGNTWSNGATTQSVIVSTNGIFTVKTTNANGCTSANSVATTITVNPLPAAPTANVTLQPNCTVQTGTIVITAPTGSGITYSIGGAYQAGTTFTGVAAGTYTVRAQNAIGCISAATGVTVNAPSSAPAAPTANVTLQPNCTVQTGTIVINAPTGTGITYSIGGAYQAGTSFTGVAAGTYNITAKNASGCISAATIVSVNAPSSAPAAPTASVTVQPNCTVQTGTIVITAPTGTGITYSIGGAYQAGTSFTGVAAGIYNVTAKNASGCISAVTIVSVNAPSSAPTTPTITAGGPTTFCSGGSVTLTSSAAPNYLWSNGATTQAITVTASGNYSVTVKNGSCSAISRPVNVAVNNCNGTYCSAGGTDKTRGYIQKVSTCGGINNNSGWNNGYGNFLNLKATYRVNTCFGIAITPGYVTMGCNKPLLFTKVWADWNQDGDFTDAGELIFAPSNASNLIRKAWIQIPATARTGNTRMRVLMSSDPRSSSCGTFTYGEAEDYTLCLTATAGRGVQASPADYIDEEEPGNLFTVYPNPVKDRLVIERSGYNEAKTGNSNVMMQVITTSGKVVLQSKLNKLAEAVDVSKLASGVYIVQIKTNSTVSSKKIFIQH